MAQRPFGRSELHRVVPGLAAIEGASWGLDVEETRVELMEACGRACARTGPARVARDCQGNLDQWLTILAGWHGGEEYVRRDGDTVEVLCAECLCALVKDGPARLSDTYCTCSLGWMKETFETVVGRPVDVTLVESVKRGSQRCRFMIQL